MNEEYYKELIDKLNLELEQINVYISQVQAEYQQALSLLDSIEQQRLDAQQMATDREIISNGLSRREEEINSTKKILEELFTNGSVTEINNII